MVWALRCEDFVACSTGGKRGGTVGGGREWLCEWVIVINTEIKKINIWLRLRFDFLIFLSKISYLIYYILYVLYYIILYYIILYYIILYYIKYSY
jgi:hypothetical protein